MQRIKASYSLADVQVKELKRRMLNWASQFSILLFLDNNSYPSLYEGYECMLAVGVSSTIQIESLSGLQTVHDSVKDWLFGHICYDHKNVLEPKLNSSHSVNIGFPLLYFFVPQIVIYINREQTTLSIESFDEPDEIYTALKKVSVTHEGSVIPKLQFNRVIDKDNYLNTIARLRKHIADGDCYEINFCCEGLCTNADIVPADVFEKLNALSPAPFAAYYRFSDKYMMCASPERYLHKSGKKILSMPIKGTASRSPDSAIDEQNKQTLRSSIKEQAENVMIVDLVRNDLSRSCETGSIIVDELLGIYSFPQVHQMISTVSGTMNNDATLTDAIKYSFPMGSMTGAPKFKVMQLIEEYEYSRRELFSGTVGYITPAGDFDFNVVIRSLFYNAATKYLSYQTGGAITYDSDAEQEWEEMRLKAWALERIFS